MMRRIFPTKLQRFTLLLEYLVQKEPVATLKTLAKEMGCSTRILREYVVEINQSLANGLFELSISHEKISLIEHKRNSIDHFYSRVIESAQEVQILEYLLFHPRCTTNEIADKFYLSPSTIYRMFNRMTPILKEDYDIELKTNPYSLAGDERKIRHFFAQIFTEKYIDGRWPIESVDSAKLEKFIVRYSENAGFKLDYLPIRWLINMIAVSHLRYCQGHRVKDANKSSGFGVRPTVLAQAFAASDADTFNDDSVRDIFSAFIIPYYAKNFLELIEKINVEGYYRDSYMAWSKVIDTIQANYGLEIPNRREVLLTMHNVTQLKELKTYVRPVLADRRSDFIFRFQRRTPKVFELVLNEVEKCLQTLEVAYDFEFLLNITYILVATSVDFFTNLLNQLPKMKVLIVSNIDIAHAKLLKSYVEYYGSRHMDCTLFKGTVINDSIKLFEKFDFVISNSALPQFTECPVVVVEDLFGVNDVTQIYEAMSKITRYKLGELLPEL